MIQYLLQILENNNRVIIPEFGAFIIKHRDPLTIVFNEFLQYNDGQLIDTIAKQDKIDKDSAKQKLDEFVIGINDILNKGESYPLGQLGVLTKNQTGRISLEEPESIDHPKEKKEKEIKIEPSTSVLKENKPIAGKEKIKPEISEDANQTKAKNEKVPIIEPVQTRQKSVQSEISRPMPSKNYLRKDSEEAIQKSIPKTNGRRINVIVWILIILFINGILVAYLFTSDDLYKLVFKDESNKEPAKIEKPVVVKTTPAVKSPEKTSERVMAAIEDSVKKVIQEKIPVKAKSISEKRFYIVAGVFSNEQNANKLVKILKQKGYNSENFGKIGTLYAVSYEAFSTKEEADKFLIKIKKEYDPKAWVKARD